MPCKSFHYFRTELHTENILSDDKSARPAAAAKQANQGRSKYVESTHHLIPPTTAAWAQALSSINHDNPPSSSDSRYALPEPGLFIGVTSDKRMQQYFLTWLKYRSRVLNCLMGSSQSVALLGQGWRTFLGHETIDLSDKKSLNKRSRNTGVDESVKAMIANMQPSVARLSRDSSVTPSTARLIWNRQCLASNTMPADTICREILWELYELNFVFELTK